MAKGNGKVKLRRTQVRRQRSEQSEPLLKRLRAQVGLASPAIGLGFVVLAIGIVLYGPEPFPYYAGQEVLQPILAKVKFKITDQKATLQSKQDAREATPNYYVLNEVLVERIRGTIGNLYVDAQQHETYEAYVEAKSEPAEEATGTTIPHHLNEPEFRALRALMNEEGQTRFAEWATGLVDALMRERLVRIGDDEGRGLPALSNVAILKDALPQESDTLLPESSDVEVEKLTLDYFNDANLREIERTAATLARLFPSPLREQVQGILEGVLREEPLFQFDLERTREAMNDEAARRPEVLTDYPAYASLAEPGQLDPSGSDPEAAETRAAPYGVFRLNSAQVDKLAHMHNRVAELLHGSRVEDVDPEDRAVASSLRDQHYLQQAGRGALVLMVALGLVTYCGLFQDRVIRNPVRALSLTLLFLIMVAVARAAHLSDIGVMFPYVVVGPVVMTAAILTMVYSQRFAIGMTSGLAVLITIAVRGDLGTLLVLTAAMAVAVYQLREIRSRHELFSTGLLNAMVAFIVGVVVVLLHGYSLDTAIKQGGSAAIASLLAIAIFFLMLAPIERIFKVATNWTLLELLDTSQPLLSRLAREAPGTFAHSLWLSSMAESACEAVGANGLLAKVGAMYHDIGKVHKAEYFAENQEAHINRHDNLSPTMSLLVIVGHVKDGIELAKEERLPRAVVRFIEEHHGTTVVRYFHHIASEKQKAAGSTREVSESEFRYPGPKPQSKETAVLMLCDGVEGAVRALPEPTAGRIENVVHKVLMERLNDGQFDDCDITLKELHRVEESLVKSLCRFYHGRVAYPKPPEPSKPTDPVPVMG